MSTSRIGFFTSTVGRKYLTGATGVLLVLYILQHLLANLQIYSSDQLALSRYSATLHRFGPLLTVAELAIALLIIAHIIVGIRIWIGKRRARSDGYEVTRSKGGGANRARWASSLMIWSGVLLIAFIIAHVLWFRFGPGNTPAYAVTVAEATMPNFRKLVLERFDSLPVVIFYVVTMIVLGVHLSHGFWSAFQSLGLVKPSNRRTLQTIGMVLAALVTLGFASIPIWVFTTGG